MAWSLAVVCRSACPAACMHACGHACRQAARVVRVCGVSVSHGSTEKAGRTVQPDGFARVNHHCMLSNLIIENQMCAQPQAKRS